MAYGVILGQTPQSEFPIGGIILWSGSENTIPNNWHLCDGTNGTPDLRNRFVVGVGGTYDVGDIGGEATHTLTINEMPSHNHTANININSSDVTIGDAIWNNSDLVDLEKGIVSPVSSAIRGLAFTGNDDNYLNHTHTLSGNFSANITINNSGSSQPHNNLPPYYALCYIMKIA